MLVTPSVCTKYARLRMFIMSGRPVQWLGSVIHMMIEIGNHPDSFLVHGTRIWSKVGTSLKGTKLHTTRSLLQEVWGIRHSNIHSLNINVRPTF